MSASAFEVGLFDPNAAQGAMLPRVWDLDTLLRSVSWLRLKNARRPEHLHPAEPANTLFRLSTTPVLRSSSV